MRDRHLKDRCLDMPASPELCSGSPRLTWRRLVSVSHPFCRVSLWNPPPPRSKRVRGKMN